jgi:hypothetical protein
MIDGIDGLNHYQRLTYNNTLRQLCNPLDAIGGIIGSPHVFMMSSKIMYKLWPTLFVYGVFGTIYVNLEKSQNKVNKKHILKVLKND